MNAGSRAGRRVWETILKAEEGHQAWGRGGKSIEGRKRLGVVARTAARPWLRTWGESEGGRRAPRAGRKRHSNISVSRHAALSLLCRKRSRRSCSAPLCPLPGVQEKIQTFLFSATLPKWIKDLCARFLKKDHKTVDLIGDDANVQVRVKGTVARAEDEGGWVHRDGGRGADGVSNGQKKRSCACRRGLVLLLAPPCVPGFFSPLRAETTVRHLMLLPCKLLLAATPGNLNL